jgi:hypothetical protein
VPPRLVESAAWNREAITPASRAEQALQRCRSRFRNGRITRVRSHFGWLPLPPRGGCPNLTGGHCCYRLRPTLCQLLIFRCLVGVAEAREEGGVGQRDECLWIVQRQELAVGRHVGAFGSVIAVDLLVLGHRDLQSSSGGRAVTSLSAIRAWSGRYDCRPSLRSAAPSAR